MIFYHVSTDTSKDGVFVPGIPEHIMSGESEDYDRVCVAPSIEDCFSAIPNGGSRLDELNLTEIGFYKVFRIDTEKLGIADSNIITSETLFKNEWVPDAEWTNEHWILKEFTVPEEDSFLIHLTEWDEVSYDLVPEHIQRIAEELYEGDFSRAYDIEIGGFVPVMTDISDCVYRTTPYRKGDSFPVRYWEHEEYRLENIQAVAQLLYGVELEVISEEELMVKEGELSISQLISCVYKWYMLEDEDLAV